MRAYLHKNYCGLGDRIIVHPRGLPPGWTESNLSMEGQERARAAAYRYGWKRNNVLHLNPETLELIEALPCL
jgi:hypothetical protein